MSYFQLIVDWLRGLDLVAQIAIVVVIVIAMLIKPVRDTLARPFIWVGRKTLDFGKALVIPFTTGLTHTEMLLIAWALTGFILVKLGHPAHFVIAFFGGVAALIVWLAWTEVVTADPPVVAVNALFGHPFKRVIVPRVALVLRVANFDGLIPIGTTQTEFRFPVTVRCAKESMLDPVTYMPKMIPALDKDGKEVKDPDGKTVMVPKPWESGGEVDLSFASVYEPDVRSKRAYQLVRVGRQAGATRMLVGMISEALRKHAAQFTWEELQNMLPEISAGIVTLLTGVHPTIRVQTDDGTRTGRPLRDTSKESSHRYLAYPEDHPDRLLKPDEVPTRAEIEYFLDEVALNGISDIRALGILIRRMNAFDFELTGALALAANLAAQEKQQRAGEEIDFKTEDMLATRYVEQSKAAGDSPVLTYERALELVRINRKRATEFIYRGVTGNPFAPLYAGAPAMNGAR